MKTKAVSILLALLLALTACGASTSAADAGAVGSSGQRETVTLSAETDGFSDVPADADYAQAAAWCYEKGLMNGVEDGRFDPDGFMTRAMLAAILYRQAGEPQIEGAPGFTDTLPGGEARSWPSGSGRCRSAGGPLKRAAPREPRSVRERLLRLQDEGRKQQPRRRAVDRDSG